MISGATKKFQAVEGGKQHMVTTQFGKYIMKPAAEKKAQEEKPAEIPVVLKGLKDWGGIQHRMKWSFVSKPVLMVDKPHIHDFDEFLCFMGSDPTSHEFAAEVEISLGQEGEKQIINTPTVVCVPKGLVHCPLNFKKIDKPIIFVRIYLAPDYVRKPVSR
jgi:hypothetical protein